MNVQSYILLASANADSILLDNGEHFTQSNFLFDFIRSIGWVIVHMLRYLSEGAESVLDAVYEFINITESDLFLNFYQEFRPFFPLALTLSFIILGLTYMFSEERPKLLKNLFMSLLILFGATSATNYLNQALLLSHDYFTSEASITNETIKAQITDLIYIDSIDWDFSTGNLNQLSDSALMFLDPNEKVSKKSDVSEMGKEVFDTYYTVDAEGELTAKEIGTKGWFDIFDPPYYYRYKINYFRIAIMLIVNILLFLVTSYKAFSIITELLVTRIIGVIAAGDLTSGQKSKKYSKILFLLIYVYFLYWSA